MDSTGNFLLPRPDPLAIPRNPRYRQSPAFRPTVLIGDARPRDRSYTARRTYFAEPPDGADYVRAAQLLAAEEAANARLPRRTRLRGLVGTSMAAAPPPPPTDGIEQDQP